FLGATGGALESLRMTDREVVLRALSFMAFGVDSYRQSEDLNAFLVESMDKFNNFADEALSELASEFKSALMKVRSIFGRYAFRKYYRHAGRRGPINKALFEAWVSAVRPYTVEVLRSKKSAIESAYLTAMNEDVAFVKSITTSTGQANAVKLRFTVLASLLSDAVASDN
ncbi:MAG TPA: hypothetical protein VGR86_01130, partial [Steroidobacteraceae bacterium]|nr:hypothetical protein [Steroidobacteraceae bacterium]